MLRDIRITPVLNGWIVKIGCQTVVFDNLEKMTEEIGEYYASPDKVTERYRNNAVNAAHFNLNDDAVEELANETNS